MNLTDEHIILLFAPVLVQKSLLENQIKSSLCAGTNEEDDMSQHHCKLIFKEITKDIELLTIPIISSFKCTTTYIFIY